MVLTVIKIDKSNSDFLLVYFQKPAGLFFYPGQYLDLIIGGEKKPFTIASSPNENHLLIATKRGQSNFKRALAALKPGQQVHSSHPAGTFILDESGPALLIAGGVGITPFRSILKHAFDNNLSIPIQLIYSNSTKNILFKDELDLWQKALANLEIYHHNSTEKGRLNKSLPSTVNPLPDTIYYLAGPPGFVENMGKILQEMGVEETDIRTDSFDGY